MSKKILNIGHRGAMGYETENSLASVQKALDLGVDAIEIDVFTIESGEVVVFHDEDVDRLTNGVGAIEKFKYDQLRKLELQGGHRIPLLDEVLTLIDGKCKINIELKGANTAFNVYNSINHYIKKGNWKIDDFLISSFNWDELTVFYQLTRNIAIGILTEEEPLNAITKAKELKAIAIHPDYQTLTQKKVTTIKEEGFKIYTWTVNAPKAIAKMKDFKVDGIITNYPDRV